MKGWRVPVVLFAIVALLVVILGVKILNNTPEKQQQDFLENYDETKLKNETNTNYNADKLWETIKKQSMKKERGVLTTIGLIGIFFIIVNTKVYYKLGMERFLVNLWAISGLVLILAIFTLNITLFIKIIFSTSVLTIILKIMQYNSIGLNPRLLLSTLIPDVGSIFVVILIIYGQWKLGDYFKKGTGFKLGLIFLPFIFLPILAFSSEE